MLNGLKAKAEAQGSVRVIVTLNTKFTALGALTSSAAASQKSSVLGLSDDVSSLAVDHGGKVVRTYDGNIPAVALIATPATLDALSASGDVAQINEDGENRITDATTTPLIGASDAHDRGFHGGGGTAVVVMDTGVEYGHEALGGRVSNAACYSAASDCPGGGTAEFGGNAGIPCTFVPSHATTARTSPASLPVRPPPPTRRGASPTRPRSSRSGSSTPTRVADLPVRSRTTRT